MVQGTRERFVLGGWTRPRKGDYLVGYEIDPARLLAMGGNLGKQP